jgi:hypothetical protein
MMRPVLHAGTHLVGSILPLPRPVRAARVAESVVSFQHPFL